MKKFLIFAAIASALLLPVAIPAQSCALCYTQAAGAGAKMIAALKSGILVLVFPPMGICILLTWMGYRKRDSFRSLGPDQTDVGSRPNADLGW